MIHGFKEDDLDLVRDHNVQEYIRLPMYQEYIVTNAFNGPTDVFVCALKKRTDAYRSGIGCILPHRRDIDLEHACSNVRSDLCPECGLVLAINMNAHKYELEVSYWMSNITHPTSKYVLQAVSQKVKSVFAYE